MKRYWHATCPTTGLNIDIKTEPSLDASKKNAKKHDKDPAHSKAVPCPDCGVDHRLKEVSKFAHKRYTAESDFCLDCQEPIVKLEDRGGWVHDDEVLSVLDPDYGSVACLVGGGVATPGGRVPKDVAAEAKKAERKNPTRSKRDVVQAAAQFPGLSRTTR